MKLAVSLLIALDLAWFAVTSASLFCNSTNEGKIVASMFSKLYRDRDASNCPAEKWLELFKDADMKAGGKKNYKIINIGFNKGYNFATWLNIFAPSMNVDMPQWYEALQAGGTVAGACGACQDCKIPAVKSPYVGQTDPFMHLVGVDLNAENIHIVNKITAHLNKTRDMSKLKLEMIHGAGGSLSADSSKNTVKIPRCAAGNEVCKIPDNPALVDPSVVYDNVPVVGVDKMVHEMRLLKPAHGANSTTSTSTGTTTPTSPITTATPTAPTSTKRRSTEKIDILHIDTEGNDAEVLKTATMLLKHHKVRALVFEYHHFLPWGNTKLSEVAAKVASNGMECFFEGQDRLWPITGMCWHEMYEFHQWSNVLCILRSDPWLEAVQPLVQSLPTLRAPYPDNTLVQFVDNPARGRVSSSNPVFLIKNNKRHAFADNSAFVKRGYSMNNVVQVKKRMIVYELFPEQGEVLK